MKPNISNSTKTKFRKCTRLDFSDVGAGEIFDSYTMPDALICLDSKGVTLSINSGSLISSSFLASL